MIFKQNIEYKIEEVTYRQRGFLAIKLFLNIAWVFRETRTTFIEY